MAVTDQPISEVAVANMAATTLDERHITSLTDDTVLGRFFASQFGFARDELLRKHPWAFARARAILSPMEGKPEFGWNYHYQLPTECLRVLPLSQMGYHNGREVPFEREGTRILTNEGPALYVKYIRRVINAAEWDVLYARALGEYLAMLAATRITGKSSYVAKATAFYNKAMEDAQMIDGLDGGTPESQNRYDIIDIRYGG